MPTVIDAFVVTLGLDPSGWKKGQRDVREQTKRTKDEAAAAGRDIEAGGQRVAQFLGGVRGQLVGLFATLGSGAAVAAFTKNTLTADAATGRLAKNLGLATEELAAWQGLTRQVGGTNAEAEASLQSLVNGFQQIQLTGQSPLIPYLQLLGVSLKDLERPTDTLLKLADAFSRMDPSRAQTLGTGMGLSPSMVTVLMQGREATEKLLAEQLRLGVVNKQQAEQAQRVQASWDKMAQSGRALGRDLVAAAAPGIEWVAEKLQDLAAWAQKHEPVVRGAFIALAGVGAALALSLAAPAAPALALVAALTALGAALGWLYDDFRKFQDGGPSAIDWRPMLDGIDAAKRAAGGLIDAFKELGTALVDAYNAVPPQVWEYLGNVLMGLARGSLAALVGAVNLIAGALRIVADIIRLVVSLLRGDWDQAWKDAGRVGKDTIDTLSQGWRDLKKTALEYWDALRGKKPEKLPPRPAGRSTETPAAANDDFRERFRQGRFASTAPERAAEIIRGFEGFRNTPYWDRNALRVGYGSDTVTDPETGRVQRVTADTRVTRAQADADLKRRINNEFMPRAAQQVGEAWSKLSVNTQAALTSVAYNYGTLPGSVAAAARTGDSDKIAKAIEGLQNHNEGINRRRRMDEAAIARRPDPPPRTAAAAPAPAPRRQTQATPAPRRQTQAAPAARTDASAYAVNERSSIVQRAQQRLAQQSRPTIGAAASPAVTNRVERTSNDNRAYSRTHIARIDVHTQATDARGIARDMSSALAAQANRGVV